MAKLKITQTKSVIGRSDRQIATIKALGLKKIRDCVELPDNESIRGMVAKVAHIVSCEEI